MLQKSLPVGDCSKLSVVVGVGDLFAQRGRVLQRVNAHRVLEVVDHDSVARPEVREDALDAVVLRIGGEPCKASVVTNVQVSNTGLALFIILVFNHYHSYSQCFMI